MACSLDRRGSIGASAGAASRCSKGVAATVENSDTTGFITWRPRFMDTEVMASISSRPQTQTPPERCRSKLSLCQPLPMLKTNDLRQLRAFGNEIHSAFFFNDTATTE